MLNKGFLEEEQLAVVALVFAVVLFWAYYKDRRVKRAKRGKEKHAKETML